jgi:YidC/Oxa1 family membrane protein insertase
MELWLHWLDAIRSVLYMLSSGLGLGTGLGIIAMSIALRAALLPISWPAAYRGCIRQKKMARLQPELQRINDQFADNPRMRAERTLALYREHGLAVMDGRGLLAALAQTPIFLGMFQVLRAGTSGGRFLWIESLSRPDFFLVLLAGLTTMLVTAANPDLPEHMRLILIIVPCVIAVVAALKVASAVTLYWTTSNCFSALQTLALHTIVRRHIRSGKIKI